ncbi:MAG: PEP-CTERM sorting domain-containing protein, partial [Phycisphaeraceae bacterium]
HDHDHASFEPNKAISFRFQGTLASWNGSEFVTEPTAGVQARNTSGPTDYWTEINGTGIVAAGTDNTQGNDVYIGNTDEDGGLHAHVDWFLADAPPEPTALLMEIEVFADGYETSEPLPLLFNYGMDEEAFEDAVYAAAEAYNIPEPGTAVLMGLGLTAVLAGRRRRAA